VQTVVIDEPLRTALERVKIIALAEGVRIPDATMQALGGPSALTVHEYATTGGITLELAGGVFVNAPFDLGFCDASELVLNTTDDATFTLSDTEGTVAVKAVLPLPGYLGVTDEHGHRIDDTAMSHVDRIRVSPIDGCAYDCRFCNLAGLRYRPRPLEQILRAIDVAIEDDCLPARHLLISGGSPPVANDRARTYFREICSGVARHLKDVRTAEGEPFEVDIMMSAIPDGPAFVDEMVDAGVSGFSFNIELFSEAAARRYTPLKHKWAREHLEPTIARAVELLGSDRARVRSLIVAGLEPVAETLAGVKWLASLGCSPVLSPFRAAPATALADAGAVPRHDLRELLDESRSIVDRYGVLLGPACVRCQHNTLSFPWDLGTGLPDV
jgi:hypothetical protein